MANDTITATTARQICNRLDSVANMLRGMRTLAVHAEDNAEFEALASVVYGLTERAHLIIDSCKQKLGDPGLGNFDDNEWDEEVESTMPAMCRLIAEHD